MFGKIAAYITRSKINDENNSRKKQFLSWNKVEKIALIVDGNVNKSELDKFIESTKKFVEVFFIELNSKQNTYSDWRCCSKKDKTFLNLPTTNLRSEFSHKNYDLIINSANTSVLFAANITSEIKAPFKCGFNNMYGELDLIVEKTNNEGLIPYLKNVLRYLEMIKTN